MLPETAENENINSWISQINVDYKLAISVDCVIFGYTDNDLYVALRPCNMPPYEGKLSLVGDLLRPNENLNESAKRVLLERTGLHDLYLEQVETFSKVDRHPLGRVVTVAYYSLIKLDEYQDSLKGHEEDMIWKNVKEVADLAFDHLMILETSLERLRKQMKDQPIGFNLLPEKFTLNQLQQLYEIVLGIELDKRNFRRKLKNLDILQDEKELQADVSHRPAKLYSFNKQKYKDNIASGFLFK